MLLRLVALISLAALSWRAAGGEPDVKPVKCLLVCGGGYHDYDKQKLILQKGLQERAHIEVTIVHEGGKASNAAIPLYTKADWAKGYDVVIHTECFADVKDVAFINGILKPHQDGVPAVNLHCTMHCYRSEGWQKTLTPWFQFTGLATTGHGPQLPIEITFTDKEHPATKGLADWTTIKEELYNNIKVLDTSHVLARGKQAVKQKDGTTKGEDVVLVWTNDYGEKKTRVINTTLGHNNETVADGRYLDLITRATLWACDKLNDKYLKPTPAK